MNTVEYDDTPTLAGGPPPNAVLLLEQMLRIREFENAVAKIFARGEVRGSTHLCQGQEAVTVGVAQNVVPGDTMVCTYRGHGATIAHGSALAACFGEILGRSGGLVGGRGGSMHFTDVQHGALGSNGIVGAHLPIAVGAALSAVYRGTANVTIAYFGDGSTNIGAFHESMNLASVWALPVVFVLENNQYGEYSPLRSTTPIDRLAERAASYGMPSVFIDGNDIVSMTSASRTAIDRARAGGGPTLIEADTYRHSGHSRNDPGTYRPPGELESWMEWDPIALLERAMLKGEQGMSEVIAAAHSRVEAEVSWALDLARSWPEPDPVERFRNVYS